MTTVFVTASGTDIGKTFVCCRLIAELDGSRALRVIKPVATGFDADELTSTDTGALLAAQGLPVDAGHARELTPWAYAAAQSPDQAAEREGRVVPYDDVVEFCRRPGRSKLTLIEGIGGVMAPLDDRHTVLDLIDAIDPIVWLVVGSYLGALSHALTALGALEQRGLRVGAVIVSESAGSPVGLDDTRRSLQRFAGDASIVTLMRPPPPVAETKLLAPLLEAS